MRGGGGRFFYSFCYYPVTEAATRRLREFISISREWMLSCTELIVAEVSPHITMQRITTSLCSAAFLAGVQSCWCSACCNTAQALLLLLVSDAMTQPKPSWIFTCLITCVSPSYDLRTTQITQNISQIIKW